MTCHKQGKQTIAYTWKHVYFMALRLIDHAGVMMPWCWRLVLIPLASPDMVPQGPGWARSHNTTESATPDHPAPPCSPRGGPHGPPRCRGSPHRLPGARVYMSAAWLLRRRDPTSDRWCYSTAQLSDSDGTKENGCRRIQVRCTSKPSLVTVSTQTLSSISSAPYRF